MAAKPKFDKNTVPRDFTMGLALVDALPVLFFGGSAVVGGLLLRSPLFFVGALLCLFAGACKVAWKIVVVLRQKNVWWMFLQMRILMPVGFALMLVAFALAGVSPAALWAGACSFPSAVFFAVGLLGMVLMIVFAAVLDSGDVRANWVEQLTNGVAQGCIFVGLLLLL